MTENTDANPSIWSVPAFLPALQPELTDDAIADVETRLGIVLPAALIAVLREQNGGYLRRTLPDSGNRMIWGIGPRAQSLGDNYWWTLLDEPQAWYPADGWLPEQPRRLVPFDSDGHWYLCLDYRSGDEPCITCFDLDDQAEQPIAANMTAYLAMLRAQDDTKLAVVTGLSLDDCAARFDDMFSRPSQAREPDDLYGYPFFRWFLEDGWIQLEPNRVRRGFVSRHDEATYQALKDLLPGTALRFPQHPDVTLIVHCDNHRATTAAHAALAGAGFDVRRLKTSKEDG
ncbi:SMI1/KNR4 family protein [Lysobacter capsici]|uniref:SMI1/KNR4 family protein n=1 Tax=Lysobacter capsici TaxID=435897 RepID=UPI001C000B82|nr:SMI1/KNR4 family protein [Lysobacter capsici]QWF15100.1 SMI1/KNR4 family protein [Lysobacter capsici]